MIEQKYYFLVEAVFMMIAVGMYVRPIQKREPAAPWAIFLFLVDFLILPTAAVITPLSFVHYMVNQMIVLALLSFTIFGIISGGKKVSCYIAIWSVVTSHFVYSIWHIIRQLAFQEELKASLAWIVYLVSFYLVFYVTISQTIAKSMPDKGEYKIGPRQIASAFGFYLVFILLNYIIVYRDPEQQTLLYYAALLFAEAYCLTVLYVQTELFKKSALERELSTLNFLWQQQKEQYEIAKDNIELINHKCHDLKHQVQALYDMPEARKDEYLSELEKSIEIYDAIVKTGNDVLDTILTDKSLKCEAENIKINCVVDGSQMAFMDAIDLYTILGNAIDNAMDEVKKFSQKEMRLIDIVIHVKGQFLMIMISNPMQTNLKFKNGLPMTTKGNNGYHGYGLPSIKHCVERYYGNISVDAKSDRFTLNMMIPIPKTTK